MDLIRRGLVATFLALGTFLVTGAGHIQADEFSDGAEKFITSLAAKAEISLLSDDITTNEHQKRFRELMLDSFDLNGVGKWVIGRYWRRASKSERVRYLDLFEKFIIATYSKRFRGYTKAKLQVNGSTKSKNSALVESQINRKNSKPIKIIWRVKMSNGKYSRNWIGATNHFPTHRPQRTFQKIQLKQYMNINAHTFNDPQR